MGKTDLSRNEVALIAGPTASGKSEIALQLAERLIAAGSDAVIINADSAQVYADLQILSARPSLAEMRDVPHLLFGAWDGADACSAADWANAARDAIAAAHAQGQVPILAGGTGLYLRSLLDGIAPVPPIDEAIRAAVRAMETADLHSALRSRDPAAAARLAPADRSRTARALEVALSTGQTLAHWQQQLSGGIGAQITLRPLILLPPRDWLYARCDARFAAMLAAGAADEVAALLARKLDPALPVMRAIGVPEIADWLAGRCTKEAMIARASQATRNYAKRQYTWFGNQSPTDWLRATQESDMISAYFAGLFHK